MTPGEYALIFSALALACAAFAVGRSVRPLAPPPPRVRFRAPKAPAEK